MKVAASSLSIGLQMNAPSDIGHGSIRSRGWAVGLTNAEERFGSGQEQEIAPRVALVLVCGYCRLSTGRGVAGAQERTDGQTVIARI